MKKIRLYIGTLLGIAVIVLTVGIFSLQYFYHSARASLWNSKMASAQKESREVGKLLEQQLLSGLTQKVVMENLQQSIINTDIQSEYICMYNQNGVELCNPNPALIGVRIDTTDSKVQQNGENVSFSILLKNGKANTGVRNFPESRNRVSEVVSVYPVQGTDWMVASHANINAIQSEMDNLFRQFLLGFVFMVILIVGLCYILIRLIYRGYEQKMETHISTLNAQVNELTIINNHLNSLQIQVNNPNENDESTIRKRIITYDKNELISIETQDIAWICLDENNLLLITFLQKQYSISGSLDELIKQLDDHHFYRANRQCIINVNAIKSILLYGKNQLEITTHPITPFHIIISKNKVADFKKWLDR